MSRDLFGTSDAATDSGVSHNLFFGLVPDLATRARMETVVDRLKQDDTTGGRWLNPARYHMTLHFLGTYSELPDELIAGARNAAANVRSPAFDIVLDRAGHFARSVGWLGSGQASEPLQQLWSDLRMALARDRIKVQGHAAFKPHVTVLRDARTALPSQPIEPIVWPVRELVLIDSQLGGRNVYVPKGSWRLEG